MYRTLLLPLDQSASLDGRIELGLGLARRMEAHLVGLVVMQEPDVTLAAAGPVPAAVGAEMIGDIRERSLNEQREQAEALRARFGERAGKAGVAHSFQQRTVPAGRATAGIAEAARYADLTIAGQPDPDEPAGDMVAPEDIAFDNAGPVLIVPYIGPPADFGRRLMVAWDGSRVAARAVRDALPLLSVAESVWIVTIDPQHGADEDEATEDSVLAEYLSRHGVQAETRPVHNPDVEKSDVLLSLAADLQADGIVMGLYGHSPLREFVLGGTSRGVLRHMTVPVICSH